MTKIKSIVVGLLAALLIGFFFIIFTSRTSRQVDEAFISYAKGHCSEAFLIINHIDHDLSSTQACLLRAYLYRQQGALQESQRELKKALNIHQRHPNRKEASNECPEIYLNLALNAFLKNDLINCSKYIEKIDSNVPFYTHALFLKGHVAFLSQHYYEALAAWNQIKEFDSSYKWLNAAFEQSLPSEQFHYWHAICQIEQLELLNEEKLKEEISAGSLLVSSPKLRVLSSLMALKNATLQETPLSLSYYKEAGTLFQEVSVATFGAEKGLIEKKCCQAITTLLLKGAFQEGCVLLRHLERWGAVSSLETLAHAFSIQILKESDASHSLSSEIFSKTQTKSLIAQELEKHFINNFFKFSERERLRHWQTLKSYTEENERIQGCLLSLLKKELPLLIEEDSDTLLTSTCYLYFWNQLATNSDQQLLLSKQLVYFSGAFWKQFGQPQKGYALMRLALDLAPQKYRQEIFNTISHELSIIYLYARYLNSLDLLCKLHAASQEFQASTIPPLPPSEISNHLADASYLFKNKRYPEAKKRINWILCLDPINHHANRMLGLIAYHAQDYLLASKTLEALQDPDLTVKETLGLSLLHLGEIERGKQMLEELAPLRRLQDESYSYLGHLCLLQDLPIQSLQWYSCIKHPNTEVQARLFIAFCSAKRWQQALMQFCKLTAPYSDLPSLQLMAVECLIATRQQSQADQLLFKAIHKEEPSDHFFPRLFQEYRHKKLLPSLSKIGLFHPFKLDRFRNSL